MRRGGRGSSLRGPWRRLDDAAIASAGSLNRGWTARNCVCITVLAACSLAMSILIWSSRHRSNAHQSSSSAMVFPLYQSYRSDGHGLGWRENRTARRRGIRGTDVLMKVRGGRRINSIDIDPFYIQMKLGVPPVKYNFQVDTGSGTTWVYCNIRTMVSTMTNWGPHGLFVPKDTSLVSCTGDSEAWCLQLQDSTSIEEPCDSSDNYRCRFDVAYEDDSTYSGLFVNESFIVMMKDKSERNLFNSFGCVTDKVVPGGEPLPLLIDGIIGLGNCKGSLLDQWTTSKFVRKSLLGVCLAKRVDPSVLPSPTKPVGYVSMGMDFKEKFHKINSVWAKLVSSDDAGKCAIAVNLLYMSYAGIERVVHSLVLLDTGSDVTFFATSVFQLLLEGLKAYASLRGYVSVPDNSHHIPEEQRVCWQPPDQILARGSPIKDFLPLVFAFEGIDSTTQQDDIKYMVVDPANYLVWDFPTLKLCVNIIQDTTSSVSDIGADMMRGELFVYDIENQRVRWRSDNCKLN